MWVISMDNITLYKSNLIDLLGDLKDKKILDYGCGKGDFIKLLIDKKSGVKSIHAVDSSEQMIEDVKIAFAEEIKQGLITTQLINSPKSIVAEFDRIICHNVLECVDDKISFIMQFKELLNDGAMFLLSHHDFDSAIYNASDKELSRILVHNFADTKQQWQEYCDGQMGRKIPGIIAQTIFSNKTQFQAIRIVEKDFSPGNYGYLMVEMILLANKSKFDQKNLDSWVKDLEEKNRIRDYYFAIDLVVAILTKD
jgi:cyclopropane fatty-acyl-phospholipid synthase-like methyltransferase